MSTIFAARFSEQNMLPTEHGNQNSHKNCIISLEVSLGFLTDDTSRLRVPFMSKIICDISAVRRMFSILKGHK